MCSFYNELLIRTIPQNELLVRRDDIFQDIPQMSRAYLQHKYASLARPGERKTGHVRFRVFSVCIFLSSGPWPFFPPLASFFPFVLVSAGNQIICSDCLIPFGKRCGEGARGRTRDQRERNLEGNKTQTLPQGQGLCRGKTNPGAKVQQKVASKLTGQKYLVVAVCGMVHASVKVEGQEETIERVVRLFGISIRAEMKDMRASMRRRV